VLEWLGAELDECRLPAGGQRREDDLLDEVRASRPVQVDLANLTCRCNCGSVGKLFLAFLPSASGRSSWPGRGAVHPAALSPTLTGWRADLARARRDRFSVAYEEHLADWAG